MGGHLVLSLASQKYNVRATYNSNPRGKVAKNNRVEYLKLDITDSEAVNKASENMDYIFICANVSPVNLSLDEYTSKMLRINTQGVENVLQGAINNKVKKVVLLSSVAAMGFKDDLEIYDEDSMFEPTDGYGKSKLVSEKVVLDCYLDKGIDVSILRPTAIYGKGSLGPLQKIVNFINKGIVPVIGDGKNLQSLTYVGNVVNAAVTLAENKESAGRSYIISDEQPYTVNEIIESVGNSLDKNFKKIHIPVPLLRCAGVTCDLITRISKRQMPLSLNSVNAIVQSRVFKADRIANELGFEFQYNLSNGIKCALS